MAGFYVVVMAFILIAIMLAFEIVSILSIVFSAVSLNKSKNYILMVGRYDYRSVKRSHTVAVVFFVLGCIGAFSVAVSALSILYELVEDSYNDTREFIDSLPFSVFTLGKYIVLLVVGIKSFVKFSEARKLHDALYRNSAMTQGAQQGGYYGSGQFNSNAPNYGYGQSYTGSTGFTNGQPQPQTQTNVPPPVYVRSDNYGFDPNSNGQDLNFSTENSVNESGVKKADSKSTFNNDIPEKVCPKCGEANNGLYKFCTLCGERLD